MKKFLLSPKGRRLHRWLGLLFGLYIISAAASGIAHNVMAVFFSPPPAARPDIPLDLSDVSLSPKEALQKLGTEGNRSAVIAVNIRSIDNRIWYQILQGDEQLPRYINAETGEIDQHIDEVYAAQIAQSFMPDIPLEKTNYLEDYDDEYINIFRLLSVYRFDFKEDRHTRVYVSTTTGSVALATNDQRQFVASFFSNFHKLNFIQNKLLKNAVLTILALGALIVCVYGLAMFAMIRSGRSR